MRAAQEGIEDTPTNQCDDPHPGNAMTVMRHRGATGTTMTTGVTGTTMITGVTGTTVTDAMRNTDDR
jgi:hypothetical protein